MPSLIAAAIGVSAAAGLAGSAISSSAASKAGKEQASAANTASDNTLAMFNQTQANLAPFVSQGKQVNPELTNLLGLNPGGNPMTAPLSAPFQPTLAQLQSSPGYQFSLDQGLKATENSMSASGLGKSGAAQKGAANFAEGLAGTQYSNLAQLYYQGNQQAYNMLAGQQALGENAAATTGSQGLTASGQAGNFSTAGAAASAAGTVGSANALGQGLSGLGGAASNYALLTALGNNIGTGNPFVPGAGQFPDQGGAVTVYNGA